MLLYSIILFRLTKKKKIIIIIEKAKYNVKKNFEGCYLTVLLALLGLQVYIYIYIYI